MSTRQIGTFGYREPPAIAIKATGPSELIDGWRAGVEHAAVRVAGELERVPTIIGHPPAAPAELCLATESLGAPVDAIVAIELSAHSRPVMECVKTHCSVEDPIGQGSTGEPHCGCVKEEYRATVSSISGTLQVIDRATCHVRAERPFGISAEARGDEATDEDRSRRAALDRLPIAAIAAIAQLFPRGFGFDQVDRHRVELTHDRNAELTAGRQLFVVDPRRLRPFDKIVELPQVVVSHADATSATLVGDPVLPTIEVGDQLHARLLGHRWSLYPMLEVGRAESDSLVGIAAAGRWSSRELPLVAEASIWTDAIPARDTVRKFAGVMAGARWPRGPVDPIAFVEAGLERSTQADATSDGHYLGYGAGVELWLGEVFVFADVRRRSRSGDGYVRNKQPVAVDHPETSFHTTTLQLTVGKRL